MNQGGKKPAVYNPSMTDHFKECETPSIFVRHMIDQGKPVPERMEKQCEYCETRNYIKPAQWVPKSDSACYRQPECGICYRPLFSHFASFFTFLFPDQ